MTSEELEADISKLHVNAVAPQNGTDKPMENQEMGADVQITCFTEDLHNATLHFQIMRLSKQTYAWIGYNSTKLGYLYAAAATRPSNSIAVASLLGGTADNTGSSMARRLVLKTGLNIVLACNIPKDNIMLEAAAEKKLIEKLRSIGYIRPKPETTASTAFIWRG